MVAQVENANQAAQLRRQGGTAPGDVAPAPRAGGWVASFDAGAGQAGNSPQHMSSAASFDRLTQHTDASAASSRQSSPARTMSPHRVPSGMSNVSPLVGLRLL